MNKRRYPAPRPHVTMPAPQASPAFGDTNSPWMTSREAAAYLRTTVGGIRNLVYRGKLTPCKPFGRLLFKRSDLDRCIEFSRKGVFNGN